MGDDVLTFVHRLLSRLANTDVANRVVANVQSAFSGTQVYIPAHDRRDEGIRLLKSGRTTDEVARELGVHKSTVYRWHGSMHTRTRKRGPGLGRDDWNL